MRHLIAALLTTLAALLGLAAPSLAAAQAPIGISAHTYDVHDTSAHHVDTTSERVPPSALGQDATGNAADPVSYGISTRQDAYTMPTATAYDDARPLVQFAKARTTAERIVRVAPATPSSLVATGVAANSGNRVLWSGGQPAKAAAEAFAKANGSKTLEMTVVGRTLEKLPYNRFTAKLWDASSAGFAATARGNANVFIGPSFRGAGSTFGRIDGPILRFKGNPILQRFEDVW